MSQNRLFRSEYNYIGEAYKFQTADGESLSIAGKVSLRGFASFGIPNIAYETRRAYKQDGETLIDFRLDSKSIVLDLYHDGNKSRSEYWQARQDLINIFRPNRGGAVTLFITRADNTKRAIDVYLQGGLGIDSESANDNFWDINLSLDLIAYDPLWYDTNVFNSALAGSSGSELVFPITFDDDGIVFGLEGTIFSTDDIAYAGNWKTYPVVTITGAYDSAVIKNTATGVEATLAVPVATGLTRIIDFRPGMVSVKDGNGDSKFNELSITSNMNMAILPDSELNGSTQAIEVTLTTTDGNSAVSVEYRTKYIGL